MSRQPSEIESWEKLKFLVICERDVGLFSLIQQVIANIPRALAEGRIPIVSFSSGCSYYLPGGYQGRDDVWEYYFEPVVEGVSVATIPESIAVEISGTAPHAPPIGYKINESYYFSSHFGDHPALAGKALKIPWKWDDPPDALRRTAAPIVAQYIRPREYINEKVNRFAARHLAGRLVIGVHIRGTDAVSKAESRAFRSGSLRPAAYIAAIKKLLLEMPGAKIFVATDAESSLQFMQASFGDRIVAYDSLRQAKGPVVGRGPHGGLMPGYISANPDAAARNGEEAVIEYLLLCKSDVLVHNGASLARTVLLARPDMPHVRTNPPQRIQGHLHQAMRMAQRLVSGDGTGNNLWIAMKGRLVDILIPLKVAVGDFFEERRNPNNPFMAAMFWCTDRVRRGLLRNPYVLVLADHNNGYLRKRKRWPARHKNTAPAVIEIRNDSDYNAGFCVMFNSVLAQLQRVPPGGMRPVVNIDQKFGYYYAPDRGTNVWEYYFEPVEGMSSEELEKMEPELITRFQPTRQMRFSLVGQTRHPVIEGPQTVRWYAQMRRAGAEMVRKFVRVKPHVMAKVEDFYEREMKGQPVIGVQLRGTDKGFDPNGRRYNFPAYMARIVPPDEYYEIVDEFIARYADCKLFVATDQQQFLEILCEHYPGRVIAYGDTRSTTRDNLMRVKDGRNYKKGEDVLIDCLLLSRADFLLRCQSNVGDVATYFNPDIPTIDMQYSRELQGVDVRIRE